MYSILFCKIKFSRAVRNRSSFSSFFETHFPAFFISYIILYKI
nr:MAG TPA: hypothetical protein [Caudoviricetes sp.]